MRSRALDASPGGEPAAPGVPFQRSLDKPRERGENEDAAQSRTTDEASHIQVVSSLERTGRSYLRYAQSRPEEGERETERDKCMDPRKSLSRGRTDAPRKSHPLFSPTHRVSSFSSCLVLLLLLSCSPSPLLHLLSAFFSPVFTPSLFSG
ncbi:hypothetical protein TGVAND_438530 [Toxoplasma gondii VAND]|uniref:Uncharacterized protein n=1 Tax=Toxoplasma gondii VAND TaxID=933077 RepID=A0A086PH19_TOXGO|nr:hypothetical protein TGVAND_438530 [Toxoplasma gondii VAND]